MFFSLTTQPLQNFSKQYYLGSLVLNTDEGWHVYTDYESISVYKGYAEGHNLEDIVSNHSVGDYRGNFCIFTYWHETATVKVHTETWRSFIMWYDDMTLTNLSKLENTVWVDSDVTVGNNMQVFETKKDVVGEIDTSPLSLDEFLDFAYNRLYQRTSEFLKYNKLPIKAFLSGGIDSMLVFSFVDKITKDYELVFENVLQWDHFWCNNDKQIKRDYWGYSQIHHWRDPCVLTSGAPGDEFLFRNPHMNKLWAAHKGIDINDFFNRDYRYSQKEYYDKYINDVVDTSEIGGLNDAEFARMLANRVVNDCQHWHLGNTLTFTPLRDLDIFKQLMRLNVDDLGTQIGGGEISIALIERNNPELMNYVSEVKNVKSSLQKIPELMSKVKDGKLAI